VDIISRTCKSLEWDRLKEFLSLESFTTWGKELCLDLEPHTEKALIRELLAETDEAASLIQARTALATQGLPELRETTQRLSAGAALSVRELLDVRNTLRLSRAAKNSLSLLETATFPALTKFIPQLHALENLVRSIDDAIDDSVQVRDSASTKLGALRREVHRIDVQIKEELTRIIHSSTLSKSLQEPLYTQRGGRYVLPVQASMRQNIPGIVHDSSASGLTVYVEPMAVLELANRMRMRETEIEYEIARILEELTSAASKHSGEIESSYRTMIELDFIFARARLALKYNGTLPGISEDGVLDFKAARHPLLILQEKSAVSSVVPNDLKLGGEHRTLVITGPNTGGKTVLLKTVGLLSLMVRAGLLLPVSSGSQAVIFSNISADIGDEQSLEQSLSTFSSHMQNIVEIVRNAHQGSLLLLDEVGAGTDPREGAAIARAVLERLNESGAITITTTHFGELKILAYTQPGFLNASLDFDEETLSPTYRLRIGVPGSSKATTIASRLGLGSDIVERANALVLQEAQDLQQVIERLELKLRELAVQEEYTRQDRAKAQQLADEADRRMHELEREQKKLRSQYANEIEDEFKIARDSLREMIASLQRQPSSQRAQQAQKEIDILRKELKWIEPVVQAQAGPAKLTVGQSVRVLSLNQIGTVESLPEDEQKSGDAVATVRAGAMRIKVPLTDLQPVVAQGGSKAAKSAKPPQPRKQSTRQSTQDFSAPIFVRGGSNTLDLRGQRLEPAMASFERFLDESLLNHVSPIMIIHGHGTGALKSAVREILKTSNYPVQFRPGENYEGGDGVTIIEF
jgi:DNA mismatch repair protein MutS2